MTPQERKIFVQALEALEREARGYAVHDELQIPRSMRDAIVAIKEALAKPEQEPDIWGCRFNKGKRLDTFYTKSAAERYVEGALRNGADVSLVGLYTTPPQRMTDEGIKKLLEFYYRFRFTKASETTHKIRGLQDYTVCITDGLEDTSKPHTEIAPRTWVDLTDDEIDYYIVHRLSIATKKNLVELIRLCEAKIKEKNI